MKGIAYGRVSTVEQRMKGYSLPEQFRECHRKATDLGVADLEEYIDDESGTLQHRKGLDEARERIRQGGIDYFITLHPDRFARDVTTQAIVYDEIRKAGTKVIFTQVTFEDSPEGRFFFTIVGALSQLEAEKIKERTMRGKRGAMRRGRIPRYFDLYGYTYQSEQGTLVVNDDEAKWVRRIFEWVTVEQLSIVAATERLNELGAPAPRGKVWFRNTARRMARNHSYTGKLILNRYNSEGHHVHKKPITFRDESEWFTIDIPPIITEEQYEAAQRAIDRWTHTRERRTPNGGHLLSGMIRCGRCNVHFRYRRNMQGVRYVTCSLRYGDADFAPERKAHRCTLKAIRANAVEEHVWQQVKEWVMNPEAIRRAVEKRQKGEARSNYADELKEVTAQVEAAEKERDSLTYLFVKGLTDKKKAEADLEALRKRIARLQVRAKELKRIATEESAADRAESLASTFAEYRDELEHATPDLRKQLVRLLVDKVLIHGMNPDDWEILTRIV